MAEQIPFDEQSNYETFRECLSEPVLRALTAPIEKSGPKKKRHAKKGSKSRNGHVSEKGTEKAEANTVSSQPIAQNDAEDLGDFIDFTSSLIFPELPTDLRTLSYSKFKDSIHLQDVYSTPLSASTYTSLLSTITPTAIETLESSGLLPASSDTTDQHHLLTPVLTTYITAVTLPPPIWSLTRTTECELCGRDWVPLTYHHLIPKSTHNRVLKRGWHTEDKLNSVAWLCRACHSFVHRLASNEGLAREYYTVELIKEGGIEQDVDKRESVEGWVRWVGGVRWKSR
ncbi:hypothetical protein P153DRAFT_366278 [Dothidotthia symphoricarpi CBS 119687]|uniref:HNH domain-containing protein n=1 Tax=Dothidotthia symphoricarpi CBS 119687 TaxID=1392245 RepID=A0A6A6AFF5_9PLEO|nr:uncharacterized protein P153DRAFT_366278 [Dothidotthia symphoricarpi CBS 119687]KAF2129768.1 hypothetical protein P153DRAFT_366278 [Dothidotthia symphoricarpi CBS 119687]